MQRRTIISGVILCAVICILVILSISIPDLWQKHLTHWIIFPLVALVMTLLIGLVLMDRIFELDGKLIIPLEKLKLKIEIGKHLIGAFLIVSFIAVVLELVQFSLSEGTISWLDPLMIMAGAFAGIIIHVIGSRVLMKRVEIEIERWEDNVL